MLAELAKKMQKKVKRSLEQASPRALARRFLTIALGCAILTFGMHNIHQVVGITEGGVLGGILLLNHWFGIDASIASPALDAVCYLVGLFVLGAGFLGWSAVSSVLLALFYALWESLPHLLPDLSAHPLVAAILGGMFVGVGAGLVVRCNASAGGDDALALSINKLTGLKLARCYLFTDLTVLLLSLSYIPITKIAFSLVTVFISSPLIDFVVGLGRGSDAAPADDEELARA
ncbi:YitT family protein [Enorma burkinafasonensis]|uniref:YitT family protein n=1 Tax=Enorma burkinafasonensis TaxID=2590867 RepID=UPI0026ED4B74|nr:YitT family protein [Enorma burkinafasonensis]MCI7731457.1 YitT family protein [Enorma burkinafasonensis]